MPLLRLVTEYYSSQDFQVPALQQDENHAQSQSNQSSEGFSASESVNRAPKNERALINSLLFYFFW